MATHAELKDAILRRHFHDMTERQRFYAGFAPRDIADQYIRYQAGKIIHEQLVVIATNCRLI